MAVTVHKTLTTGLADAGSATTYNFTVTAPDGGANRCVIAAFSTRRSVSDIFWSSSSGLGLTWTFLANSHQDHGSQGRGVFLIVGTGTPDGGTNLSVTWSSGCTEAQCIAVELDGVDVTTPGSIDVQSNGDGGTGTSRTCTLGSAPSSGFVLGAVMHAALEGANPDGWTEIGDLTGNDSQSLMMAYSATNDQSWAPSWTTSSESNAIMIEVLAAAGGDTTITPSAVAAVASVPAPAIIATASITPAAVAAVAAVPAPTILTGALITPAAVAAIAAVPAPTITATATVTPAAVAAVVAVPDPTVLTGTTPTPDAVAAIAAVPAPTITAAATLTPSAVATVATVPSPTITATAVTAPAAVAAVVAVPAPTLTATALLTPAAVTAVVAVPAPSLVITGLVTPAAVAAVVTVPVPTLIEAPGTINGIGTLWSAAVLSGERGSDAVLDGTRESRAALDGMRTSEGV